MLKRKIYKWIANLVTPAGSDLTAWERKNRWLRRAGMHIGRGAAIDCDFQCLTGLEENITLEDHVVLGMGVKIWNFNTVSIGRFSMFAADVTLVNGGHDKNTFEPFSGPLRIGKGCWIGNGARIVGPVSVGDNAIVAAGAVVVQDVPPASIVAGVPAKVIGMRELPEKVWHLGGRYFCPRTFTLIE